VVITGGVISGIGKGVTASSLGLLLKMMGLRPTAIKVRRWVGLYMYMDVWICIYKWMYVYGYVYGWVDGFIMYMLAGVSNHHPPI
jgi:hypothetical protein